MSHAKYFETGNRYTNPVRYFKANDPYYYEVDNIPVKQLEENCNFLKDQVDGLLGEVEAPDKSRNNISELQPHVDGTNSKVKVMPGRFSARINDAMTLDKLQFISQVVGVNQGARYPNAYRVETNTGPNVAPVLAKWQSKIAANATNMNGLFERSFVYPMLTSDTGGYNDPPSPGFGPLAIQPGFQGQIWTNRTNQDYWYFSTFGQVVDNLGTPIPLDPSQGFRKNGRLESEFIKRWRGVTRIAIVDVPSELEIEIPAFDSSEFFYIDTAGNHQNVDATQRIDLVFIYSKPVDQPSTKVVSYTAGGARNLTEPVLGIVKGAGIGLDFRTSNNFSTSQNVVSLQSTEGTTLMLPNPSDEIAAGTGFTTSAGVIRGSFPSPDDLMNLSPLLSENIIGGDTGGTQDSLVLIGQSILPVAYVVVNATAGINASGGAIVTVDDLIDIRPFFRTAELAYNERSGIAAATPQVSLANPVITEAYGEELKYNLRNELVAYVDNHLPQSVDNRVVGAGMIKGGMFWGVEGALASYLKDQQGIDNYAAAKVLVASRYGYPLNSIPDLPDWDLARWGDAGPPFEMGTRPNDRVNYCQWGVGGSTKTTEDIKYSPFRYMPGTDLQASFASDDRIPRVSGQKTWKTTSQNTLNGEVGQQGITSFFFVEKTITIDRGATASWMSDYYVNVQLQNCAPLSCRASFTTTQNGPGASNGVASVWVDRRDDEFTIFVSWASDDWTRFGEGNGPYPWGRMPKANRSDGGKFAGFVVLNSDIMTAPSPNGGDPTSNTAGKGSVTLGTAIYPTVSFQIIGISSATIAASNNLNAPNPTIELL